LHLARALLAVPQRLHIVLVQNHRREIGDRRIVAELASAEVTRHAGQTCDVTNRFHVDVGCGVDVNHAEHVHL
jgi:hypothetical protein